MVYDLNMLKSFYASYKGKMEHVRAALKRPLTLAEKILYTHLYNVGDLKNYERGEDYVNFRPDRVSMQDATGGLNAILKLLHKPIGRCTIFCVMSLPVMASVSGNRERVSFTR